MRIISGSRRGHKLFEFEGEDIRPTTDRVKESIFNLIIPFVSDARVLDLFCGSGALMLEALSRGAERAVCVDVDKKSLELAKKNTKSVKFDDLVTFINKNAAEYLDGVSGEFDLIFLDPPYNKGFIKPIIEKIVQKNILSEYGVIVLESDDTDEHGEFDGLSIYRQRKYGRTYITIYRKC